MKNEKPDDDKLKTKSHLAIDIYSKKYDDVIEDREYKKRKLLGPPTIIVSSNDDGCDLHQRAIITNNCSPKDNKKNDGSFSKISSVSTIKISEGQTEKNSKSYNENASKLKKRKNSTAQPILPVSSTHGDINFSDKNESFVIPQETYQQVYNKSSNEALNDDIKSKNIAYSWEDLKLGTESGSAALNEYINKKPFDTLKDCEKVTAHQLMQIFNSLRAKTCLPPVGSSLHKVVQMKESFGKS